MDGSLKARKRWDWINGWLTAALHSVVAWTAVRVDHGLSVDRFLEAYSRKVRGRVRSGTSGPPVEEWEIDYVFQLEEELWGVDWADYRLFFGKPGQRVELLETFKFVLAFYIAERCLKLLAEQGERYRLSRGKLRRRMFGSDGGVFTVEEPWAAEAMGPPFCLRGETTKVSAGSGAEREWKMLRGVAVPSELKEFYKAVTRKEHFTQIVETGLIRTRRDHLVKAFRRPRSARLPGGTKAWWYDVLWHYSESVRYHPLAPSSVSLRQPFHWNRTVRWLTSVLVSGLLLVAAERGAPVREVWHRRSGRAVWRSLGGAGRFG